ncbi:TetR/AcrR family transcriptional regulator [Streptomyces sp. NPDC047097]|uniref:TetR/AcrR family transcriptional regulator n=1 Tax=Streptomyces sp. NPDC047097 TaxID=3155260 RepID=UPI0033EB4136
MAESSRAGRMAGTGDGKAASAEGPGAGPAGRGRAPDATRRSERSRRAIYDAALALVAEIGYPKTTIEGIAARAGVGKQTIYRWWPSKADVLLEAFMDLARQANEAMGAEADSEIPDTGDLEADLKLVLRATVDELNDPVFEAPYRALAAEGMVNPEIAARFVGQLLEPQLQLYVRRLNAARAAGQVRPEVDPRIALELFTAPLTVRWLLRTQPLGHDYADRLVEYALGGIAPR